MSEAKLFVPRTDSRLEAVRVPPNDPILDRKDREEQMQAIAHWLRDSSVEEIEVSHDRIRFFHNYKHWMAIAGDWIMVRPEDVVVLSNDEFCENYESATSSNKDKMIQYLAQALSDENGKYTPEVFINEARKHVGDI